MQLQDKTIVITGAARGIGAAVAVELAGRGADLALVDLDADACTDTRERCRRLGVRAESYGANVADETQVTGLFGRIAADFGRLDGLVNNAGITRDALLIKVSDGQVTDRMSLAQWQSVIDVNLTGVFLCGREAAASMVGLGCPGVIVNISSISRAGNRGQTNYSASKAGVIAMTVAWAGELARHGIRTGAVAPGFINTEMVAAMKPQARDTLTAMVPLRRTGETTEIASAVAFIFENDYFSGRCIEVDGGLRL